jgi:hypothetical protein
MVSTFYLDRKGKERGIGVKNSEIIRLIISFKPFILTSSPLHSKRTSYRQEGATRLHTIGADAHAQSECQ